MKKKGPRMRSEQKETPNSREDMVPAASNEHNEHVDTINRPQKKIHRVNVNNLSAVKGAIDDQVHKYFVTITGHEVDHTLLDIKNAIGTIACIVAATTYFLTSMSSVVAACAVFLALILLIQYIHFYVEYDTILMTKTQDDDGHVIRVNSNFKARYSQFIEVVITLIPKYNRSSKSGLPLLSRWKKNLKKSADDGRIARTVEIDVAKHFDKEGRLHKPKLRARIQEAHKKLLQELRRKR